MKPSVTLIDGRHITAADKRTIIQGIEWLRAEFAPSIAKAPDVVPNYGGIWIRRGGSIARYSIVPLGGDRYNVTSRKTETTDTGRRQERSNSVTVSVAGIAPLYLPDGTTTKLDGKQLSLAL